MADKEITMVLKVDLECERCKKKIKKVLDKIKDKMNITDVSYDDERNLVILSGPFDAEKVRRKLCCEAGRIIKDMDVIKAPEEKKIEENTDDGGMENVEDARTAAAAPAVNVDLRPLLKKMLERPKAKTQPSPCTCCSGCNCGKQTAQPPAAAQVVVGTPAASSVVSGHGYEADAPSLSSSYYYYGVPVYSIEGR